MKQIIGRLLSFLLALLLLTQVYVYTKGTYEWYGWWSGDKQSLEVSGYITDLVIKRGKYSNGDKIIRIKNNKSTTNIEGQFRENLLIYLESYKGMVNVSYYPDPSGIYSPLKISNVDNKVLYENEAYEGTVLAVVVLCVIVLMFSSSMFLLLFTIGRLKFDNA